MATKKKPTRRSTKPVLTKKQQAFVEHYLTTFNASEAARRAGYPAKSAYSVGWENLRKPEIAALVTKRLDELAMGASEALGRLSEQARGNLAEFYDVQPNGTIAWDFSKPGARQAAHLLKKVRTTRNVTRHRDGTETETIQTEVELHDAQTALLNIAKHHKLLTDELNVNETLTVTNLQKLLDKRYGPKRDAG